ncbi:protein TIPIN homolog, partial [Diaphorina citri]|uniref:TIMELESS-interacting protein n=1 Tax=Diaphorina citri TaxID=121845 RepID=A0A1S4ERM4_DIACI
MSGGLDKSLVPVPSNDNHPDTCCGTCGSNDTEDVLQNLCEDADLGLTGSLEDDFFIPSQILMNDEDEQPPPNPSEPSEDAVRVAPKKKVIRNPQPKLNAQRLTGPRGIQCIEQYFKDVKFKGKGHELADLNTIMSNLEHWANRLYPKSNFVDVLKRLEVLGHKRPVMTHIKKIRLGMIEELNQDSNLVLSDTETPAQPQQPTSDDIFNDLLASQPSQHITPVVK